MRKLTDPAEIAAAKLRLQEGNRRRSQKYRRAHLEKERARCRHWRKSNANKYRDAQRERKFRNRRPDAPQILTAIGHHSVQIRSLTEMQAPAYLTQSAKGLHLETWETADQLAAKLTGRKAMPKIKPTLAEQADDAELATYLLQIREQRLAEIAENLFTGEPAVLTDELLARIDHWLDTIAEQYEQKKTNPD